MRTKNPILDGTPDRQTVVATGATRRTSNCVDGWCLLSTVGRQATEDKAGTDCQYALHPTMRVTAAITDWLDAGPIRERGEYIEVLDWSEIERRVFDCYGVVKREFDRLLLPPWTMGF
ncbi:hypothetical protein [Paraburkholderia sp. IW21]|uniref:hypothetical protein n=1 Tax=Paraburkholderia sp. IW21 TaxID=3242488 RepID=UPI0035223760